MVVGNGACGATGRETSSGWGEINVNRTYISMVLAGMTGRAKAPASAAKGRQAVVLLHGLGRTAASMRILEWALQREGYRVVNQGYPSRKACVEDLADETLPRALSACDGASKVHFVTHSMGAMLLRCWAGNNSLPPAGRAVLLGPPNGGSEIVDRFGRWKLFALMNGPAGPQLGTAPDALPSRLGAVLRLEVGIIAGDRPLNPMMSALIGEPNDGKVSVRSAFSVPSADRLVLPVSHTWMMMNPVVVDATIRFLAEGRFAAGTS